jgi:hypothetical protein
MRHISCVSKHSRMVLTAHIHPGGPSQRRPAFTQQHVIRVQHRRPTFVVDYCLLLPYHIVPSRKMAATASSPPSRPKSRKGLLAFLDDSATFFPYDADEWKAKLTAKAPKSRRSRRRQRRAAEDPTTETLLAPPGETVEFSTVLATEAPQVILLFFYDPQQSHSMRVRNSIVHLLASPTASPLLLCCAISLGHAWDSSRHEFIQATGMLDISVASPIALSSIFTPRVRSHGLPYLMLVSPTNGRAFGQTHEDLALEWNDPTDVLQRWVKGESGLSRWQQVCREVLFPSFCAIL